MSSSSGSSVRVLPVADAFTWRIRSPTHAATRTSKFRLSNGLEVYAVHDPGATEAGAAVTVETGSWRDEPTAQGTAHFLEHMLFLGTAKYPDEWAYDRYIKDHGGAMNAYTASDHTTYMFSVTPDAFAGALDRFAPFFHAPLFNPDCVEREMNAVDEEFRKNLSDDGWRHVHVMKELADPAHPFAFFNTGNLESMRLISQDTLRKWYEKYYVAPAMRLVMYSPQPIEWMQQRALELFSPVRSAVSLSERSTPHDLATARDPLRVAVGRPMFPPSMRGAWVHVVPLKNVRELSIGWEVPAHVCRSKAASLVAFVLGHEGEGSLYAHLHADDLIERLSAGPSNHGADNWTMDISMGLTEKGLLQLEHIVERVFATIRHLAAATPFPEHVREEMNRMARVRYKFQSRGSVFHRVTQLGRSLRDEPLETYPLRSLEIEQTRQDHLRELFAVLTPDNVTFELTAPADAGPYRVEKHMGAQYRVRSCTDAERTRYRSAQVEGVFSLPRPNRFLPDKLEPWLDLQPQPQVIVPHEVAKNDRGHLYVLPDCFFGNPVVHWVARVHTLDVRGDDVMSTTQADVWASMVREQLRVLNYPASQAGLSFQLGPMATGVVFSLRGYSDKALDFWRESLERVATMPLDPVAFARVKDQLLRALHNKLRNGPVRQALEAAMRVQMAKPVDVAERIRAAEALTLDDVRAFQQRWWRATYIEAMLTGQTTLALARDVLSAVAERFQGAAVPEPGLVTLKPAVRRNLDVGSVCHETSSLLPGHAAVLMIDVGSATAENGVMAELLATAVSEPFYSELRTRQQTGYIVSSGAATLQNERRLVYLVSQSSTVTAADLMQRYERFLDTLLSDWTRDRSAIAQRFDNIRRALETQLAQPYDNLDQLAGALEMMAFERHGAFDERARAVEFVRTLTVEDLLTVANARFVETYNTARTRVTFTGTGGSPVRAKL